MLLKEGAQSAFYDVVDVLFGQSPQEGQLSELTRKYTSFLFRARNHVGIVSSELPEEIFADSAVIDTLRRLVDQRGSKVEIVCHQDVRDSSPLSLELLSSAGVQIYLSTGSLDHFTVLDGGKRLSFRYRQMGDRGEAEWRQSFHFQSTATERYATEFLLLKEGSQLLAD